MYLYLSFSLSLYNLSLSIYTYIYIYIYMHMQLRLQQTKTAPNLFQRGVEHGKRAPADTLSKQVTIATQKHITHT